MKKKPLASSKKKSVLKTNNKSNRVGNGKTTGVALSGRLGRGLSALFSEEDSSSEPSESNNKTLLDLPIKKLFPATNQARTHFNEEKIKELASSIKRHGVIEPLIVRRKGADFEIVAGERRFRAAKILGMETLPAVLREEDASLSQEVMLVENIQRENLTAIEEAKGYKSMMEAKKITQVELAQLLGKSRSHLANMLRLLKLPPWIMHKIEAGNIAVGTARALIGLNETEQKKLVEKIEEEGLNARYVEREVSLGKNNNGKRSMVRKKKRAVNKLESEALRGADLLLMEGQLRDALKTKVALKELRKGVGRIEIEYYDYDELEALLKKLS